MRKILALLVTTISALSLSVLGAGNASALGGETLGCRIAPGTILTFQQHCHTSKAANSFTVAFQVQNETAPSTYSWTVPAAYAANVSSGCTSTSNACVFTIPNEDANIFVSVTLTQNGVSEQLPTASASLSRYCGSVYC